MPSLLALASGTRPWIRWPWPRPWVAAPAHPARGPERRVFMVGGLKLLASMLAIVDNAVWRCFSVSSCSA